MPDDVVKTRPPKRHLEQEAMPAGEDAERFVMETVMEGIGKQAAFYRAYLPHDRSLIPVAVAFFAIGALWLCLYLISEERNPQTAQIEARAAAVLVSRPVSH
jgi:hypothetical protein